MKEINKFRLQVASDIITILFIIVLTVMIVGINAQNKELRKLNETILEELDCELEKNHILDMELTKHQVKCINEHY